jgi:hypothetical protein
MLRFHVKVIAFLCWHHLNISNITAISSYVFFYDEMLIVVFSLH